jgi:hypothetical protein
MLILDLRQRIPMMKKKPTILSSWIYGKEDYEQMFSISPSDLNKKILDYPGNLSSFNAEMYQEGHDIVSGDLAYNTLPKEIGDHVDHAFAAHLKDLKASATRLKNQTDVHYNEIIASWQKRKHIFLNDYPCGFNAKRYQFMQMPDLPFDDHHFELALCSDLIFHTQLLKNNAMNHCVSELCRVAEEVRIFPLLNEAGKISDALGPIMLLLQQQNFGVEVKEVAFDKIKGSNAMLRVWAKECCVES